jgi:predicted dehydrogenase
MNKKKLRGAVIGYGFIAAKGHIPTYIKRSQQSGDVQISALADVSPVRRSLARKALPDAQIYSDYRDLLASEGANLDFVDIATPPCDHASIAHAALGAGLHVLCEKPLTRTTEEARSLLAHAQAVERVIFPCHNYNHAAMMKAIRGILQSGRIGKVHSVNLNTYRDTHAKGVAEWKTDWRRENRYSGGGIAMDHGSHSFYLAFDWLESYPSSVSAAMSNLQPGTYDTEDEFSAVLRFPTGVAQVHLTWTAGERKVLYTIEGDKGRITMENDTLEIASNGLANGSNGAEGCGVREVKKLTISSDWGDASHACWFNSLFDQFRQAIDCGDYVGKDAQEAFLCVQLINTAYRSGREQSRELPVVPYVPGD